MESNKVDMFMSTVGNRMFSPISAMVIRDKLKAMDNDKFHFINSLPYKDPTTMLLISIFAGTFGVDRIMLGQVGLGILKMMTLGGCGLWALIDWFRITDMTKQFNNKLFQQATM